VYAMRQYTCHTEIFVKCLSLGVIFYSSLVAEFLFFAKMMSSPHTIAYHQKRLLFVPYIMKCNVDHSFHIAMFIVLLYSVCSCFCSIVNTLIWFCAFTCNYS
jgi:hypothetical protein